MIYRKYTGKTPDEAKAKLDAEKKVDPDLHNAILVSESEDVVSSFMGLRQEKQHTILVAIPEHNIERKFPRPEPRPESRSETRFDSDKSLEIFTPIERRAINNKKTVKEPQESLFAEDKINEAVKEVQKVTKLRNTSKAEAKISAAKENEIKKEIVSIVRDGFDEIRNMISSTQLGTNNSDLMDALKEERKLPDEYEIQKKHMRWIEKYLIERDFSQHIIDDILNELAPQELNSKETILKSVEKFLLLNTPHTDISLENYKYGNEILFIGASGVGKTSTLVKLAAHLSVMRKKSYRFISIDRNKAMGETQLETLAGFMRTQFHSVKKQDEFYSLLRDKSSDFTFIDTAGKGPKNEIAIKELHSWINGIGHPVDTHLVVSATTKATDLEYICETYNSFNYNHILVTKLDETKTFGSIISLAYKYQKSLSFVTDGQEIPQDFGIADIRKLIKSALK